MKNINALIILLSLIEIAYSFKLNTTLEQGTLEHVIGMCEVYLADSSINYLATRSSLYERIKI